MSRTKPMRAAAKRLLAKPPGPLVPIDLTTRWHPDWMSRAYKNNRYVVMIADRIPMTGGIVAARAMVQRHDDTPIRNHWRELQNIKNALFGPESTAIEIYPPQSKLTDEANIYWLWVLPDGAIPTPLHTPGDAHAV
jgi:hypothetical protein